MVNELGEMVMKLLQILDEFKKGKGAGNWVTVKSNRFQIGATAKNVKQNIINMAEFPNFTDSFPMVTLHDVDRFLDVKQQSGVITDSEAQTLFDHFSKFKKKYGLVTEKNRKKRETELNGIIDTKTRGLVLIGMSHGSKIMNQLYSKLSPSKTGSKGSQTYKQKLKQVINNDKIPNTFLKQSVRGARQELKKFGLTTVRRNNIENTMNFSQDVLDKRTK